MRVTLECRNSSAFTLVELLVVIAIVALLAYLVLPSFSSLQGNQTLFAAADEVGDVFKQARAYAMGNDTHVFVGLAEYDASQPASAMPQKIGHGRLVVAAVASIDGTSQYTTASWNGSGTTLVAILKPEVFENIHLAKYDEVADNETPPMISTGSMKRPEYTATANVGDNDFISSTTFNYPLTGPVRYPFVKVIDFDSQGVARVINFDQKNTTAIPGTIEVDLQLIHGATLPANPSDTSPLNYVAIQCDGMTGTVQVYK